MMEPNPVYQEQVTKRKGQWPQATCDVYSGHQDKIHLQAGDALLNQITQRGVGLSALEGFQALAFQILV